VALAVALLVAATVTLTGCGPGRDAGGRQGPRQISPADVQQREAEVDDVERVVGSAEAETANDG
jgi:predicted small lipoprotein YifL